MCSLSSSVGQEPWVWDKQQPTHLQAWPRQGLGSLDLVTPVLKATHNFHYSVMERMKEKNLRSRSTAKLLSGLLTDLLGMEWPPVHAFSYYYSEVFTVCNFPPSFLTATTQVWVYKMYCEELSSFFFFFLKKSSPGIHSQCASLQVQTKWKAYFACLTSLLYPYFFWDGLSIHFPPSENRKEMSTYLRNTVKQSTHCLIC